MDLDDDEMDGMSEWIMERVYCLERGVQTGGSQKRRVDKNLQTVNLDRMHMMIGRRLASFEITHPEGWQKLENLDEIRTGGIAILRNVYDSFAQLQNLFQPRAYQTPFANLNQAVCRITGVGKETVGKWCVRKDEPIYKGILDQKAQEKLYNERRKLRRAALRKKAEGNSRNAKKRKMEEDQNEDEEDKFENEEGSNEELQ